MNALGPLFDRAARAGAVAVAVVAVGIVAIGVVAAGPAVAAPSSESRYVAADGSVLRFRAFAPEVIAPAGLVVQFHGDGAYEYDRPASSYSLGGRRGIVAVSRWREFVTVAVKTPSSDLTWWTSGRRNADRAAQLIRALRTRYGVEHRPLVLVGYSGGAQLVTQFLLPRHPDLARHGAAVLFAGGGSPRAATKLAASGAFELFWYTGGADDGRDSSEDYDALGQARAGSSWYRARGFRTAHAYPARVGHELDGRFGGVLAGRLDAVLARQPVPRTPRSPWAPRAV